MEEGDFDEIDEELERDKVWKLNFRVLCFLPVGEIIFDNFGGKNVKFGI